MVGDSAHPIRQILEQAARGVFPTPDGTTRVLPPCDGQHGVVAMTAAIFVLTDQTDIEILRRIDSTDVGAAMRSHFLSRLADDSGMECGFIDLVMARQGIGGPPQELTAVDSHVSPRVARSERHRGAVQILTTADGTGVVTMGRGLAGRREMSIELPPDQRFGGLGTRLIRDGLRAIGPDDYVFAQVSPGNAASLRAFLAAGFRPIGSEALFTASP